MKKCCFNRYCGSCPINSAETTHSPLLQHNSENRQVFLNPVIPKKGYSNFYSLNSCFGWVVQGFAVSLGSSYYPVSLSFQESPTPQLTVFVAVTHLMSYLWEGAITLQVTWKGSPTIRTWSAGSIITDTGFSSTAQRQAGKDPVQPLH